MLNSKYIDPMIGTVGDEKATSMHGGGKTHPGACTPGGMVQLSPDTVTGGDNGTGYNYCQDTIEGFSFNHMSGIGWYGDLGNLQIMPVVGKTDLRSGSNHEIPFIKGNDGWKSKFSHNREVARAGYYSVELEKYNILAEATASAHTGMLRFTYPENEQANVIFNFSRRIAGHSDYQHIDIVNNSRIEGYIKCTPAGGGFGRGRGGIKYTLYFACEFSKPAKNLQFFENEKYCECGLDSFEGEDVGLFAEFGTNLTSPLVLHCGISYVDLDGARNNLKAEDNGMNFDKMAESATALWDDALDRISVSGSDETDMKLFYTCLYHALLDPRSAVDVDGRFCIADEQILTADYTQRTMFSGWDVYRSEFPLLTIIDPDMVNDEVNSLLAIAKYRNSSFPRWELMGIDSGCMVGDPGLLVVADAYVKGIRNFDCDGAYEVALASAKVNKTLDGKEFNSLRPDSEQYLKHAYIPNELSDTLEYLLADYAMSEFAKAMGKNQDSEYFYNRAKRFVENYNPELGYMAPRDDEGNFANIKNEYDCTGCVESNILQQSWFAPFDVKGLSELFGKERMIELLEGFFERAEFSALWNEDYNHSNEPCHNITHYFNLLGLPHRTQYWTRRVQKEAYRLGAFGFCGNEDVGQLSAWYVLSAVGFAQICPCDKRFWINTPLFKSVKIRLNSEYHSCKVSDLFTVVCDKDPIKYPYIKTIRLNGAIIDRMYLTYEEITAGGVLEFELSEKV